MDYLKDLKDHKLELVQSGIITAYYLRPSDKSRMMSTMIIFSPEGIVIMGDLCPAQNGVISSYGYGIDWFSGKLSGSYLCEKFLKKRWVREIAEERLKDKYFREGLTEEQIVGVEEILRWIGDMGPEKLYEELMDLDIDCSDGVGYGYDPIEAGLLCAIQEKFRELGANP